MADELGSAVVPISADLSKLDKDLAGARGKIDGALEGTTTKTSKLGGAINKLKGPATAMAATGFVGFLSDSANAAADEEANIARLDASLINAGTSYAELEEEIESYLLVLREKAIDDQDARDSLSELVQATGSYEEAMKLLPQTMDLARAKNIDFETAAKLVGRVANGNTSMLSRYGITIDKNATASEALAIMQEKFAGAADRYGETTRAHLETIGLKLGDFKESVGGALGNAMPFVAMLPGFSMGLTSLSGAGAAVAGLFPGVASALGLSGGAASAAAPGMTAAAGGTTAAGAAATGATPGFLGLNAAMLPIIAVIAGIVAVAGILYLAWTNNWGDIQGKLEAVWAIIEPILKKLWEWLQTTLQNALKALADVWNNVLAPALDAIWSFISTYLLPIFKDLFELGIAVVQTGFEVMGEVWDKILKPALEPLWDFIDKNLLPILKDVADWLGEKLQGPLNAVKGLFEKLEESLGKVKDALTWVRDRIRDLKDAISGFSLPDWLTPGSPTPFETGLWGIRDAAEHVNDAMQSLGNTLGKARTSPLQIMANQITGSSLGETRANTGQTADSLILAEILEILKLSNKHQGKMVNKLTVRELFAD